MADILIAGRKNNNLTIFVHIHFTGVFCGRAHFLENCAVLAIAVAVVVVDRSAVDIKLWGLLAYLIY